MADYAYNTDRIGYCGTPNFNQSSFDDISSSSDVVTEPVTLDEIKDYLRLSGFDDSGEFSFDDVLLQTMIKSGREYCEAKTGCSLIPKTIRAYITNGLGMILMPAGPVTGIITGVNEADVSITDQIKLVGSQFPQLRLPLGQNMVFEYEVGYTVGTIPAGLKQAIMAWVAYVYEHRGDELDKQQPQQAATLCKPFVKYSAWA